MNDTERQTIEAAIIGCARQWAALRKSRTIQRCDIRNAGSQLGYETIAERIGSKQ